MLAGIPERKSHTVDVAGINPIQSTAPLVLNLVSAASGATNRIGDTMVVTSIQLRFCIKATGTSINACYRVMLIWDKQPNKAIATLDDIFVGAAPHGPLDFMELDNRKRFSTIYNSHVFAVGANTNDNDNRSFEFYCDSKAETVWTDGTGEIGSLTTGALLLVTISDQSASASVAVFDFQSRIRFTDGQYAGTPSFTKRTTHGDLQGN